MSDTCDRCDRCHRPMVKSAAEWDADTNATCWYRESDAYGKIGGWVNSAAAVVCAAARDRWLESRIATLEAELAEARKPRWEGRTLLVPRTIVVAVVFPADGGWAFHRSEPACAAISARGYATESEAKAAAERACGVEVANGPT